MTGAEQGFLLLTSHLGDMNRNVLTVAQFRVLAKAVSGSEFSGDERELLVSDLMDLGFTRPSADRVIRLLSQTEQLSWYLETARRCGCKPLTRISEGYPQILHKRLGMDCPGCLWYQGDPKMLEEPAVSLVGSRELRGENRAFAEEVGVQAARQGFVLVSGNARGADTVAQEACLAAGGKVISVVADELSQHPPRENVLYVSEDGFDLPFSSLRALSRNRVIHALGRVTFVAQATLERGGTWDGTTKNLRFGWNKVLCFRDGSEAAEELIQRGAAPVGIADLEDITRLMQLDQAQFSLN